MSLPISQELQRLRSAARITATSASRQSLERQPDPPVFKLSNSKIPRNEFHEVYDNKQNFQPQSQSRLQSQPRQSFASHIEGRQHLDDDNNNNNNNNTNSESPSSSFRSLRRTSNYAQLTPPSKNRPAHFSELTLDSQTPSPLRIRFAQSQQQQSQSQSQRRPLAYVSSTSDSSSPVIPNRTSSLQAKSIPSPPRHISKRTAAAVLYALEDVLRGPNSFTPDLEEESEPMSYLLRGGGGDAAADLGRRGNITQAAALTGSQRDRASPIIGPKEVMRNRAEREARRKLEAEATAREQQRAQTELRQHEGATAPQAQFNPGGRTSQSHIRATSGAYSQRSGDVSSRTEKDREPPTAAVPARRASRRSVHVFEEKSRQDLHQSGSIPQGDGPADVSDRRAPDTSSFPHAFERWETLSAHWEGLTSFWIRRLEANRAEFGNDPLSQQLSRQVTDLSAAGANLFHGIVELQRLRASSERKFQRWFYETAQEQAKDREIIQMLETQLQQEREGRDTAAYDQGMSSSTAAEIADLKKAHAEMKRELKISRDESRRAWEELGRREQEEHQRVLDLSQGRSVQIGGETVVPTMRDAPIRRGSDAQRQAPQTRTGPFPGGPDASRMGGQELVIGGQPSYSHARAGSDSDPYFDNVVRNVPTQQTSGGVYLPSAGGPSQPVSNVQPQAHYSEGQFILDSSGQYRMASPQVTGRDQGQYVLGPPQQFPASSPQRSRQEEAEDSDDEYDTSRDAPPQAFVPYGGYGSESMGRLTGEYSGEGYGGGPGWDIVPGQHLPTTLSDVMEEDERSRTSASQMSRRGSGMN